MPACANSVGSRGPHGEEIWEDRRQAVREAMDGALERAPGKSIRRLGQDYLKLMDRYAAAARLARPVP